MTAFAVVAAGCASPWLRPAGPAHAPVTAAESAAPGTPARDAAPSQIRPPAPPVARAEQRDLWGRIRDDLTFDGMARPEVRRELAEYRGQARYFAGVVDRAEPYLHFIVEELERRNLPSELALLPILESGFQPEVVSPHGAAGLWQFMGGTGTKFGLTRTAWYDGRLDVVASTEAALSYIERLSARFDGDWLLAVAAYNAGWGNIERAVAKNGRAGQPRDVWSLSISPETRRLVARLLALAEIVRQPAAYGIVLRPIADRRYFAEVVLDRPVDLRRFVAAAGLTDAEFARLNPGFRRGHTGPGRSARLLLPISHARDAQALVARLPVSAPPPLAATDRPALPRRAIYRVREGDSLWAISRRFKVTVAQLLSWNRLPREHTLQPGQELRVAEPT